ncbi:hypothetical protein KQ894_14970, partial [Listeria monocytogenes]|nr:hypothetical protein [Listeria monocytogenes]
FHTDHPVFSCSKIEQKQLNTWVSFQSAEQPLLGQFSVSGNNFEHHVRIGESLEVTGKLPTCFMLLPPQSWHPDVWTDVARMRTLNAQQYSKG